MSPREITRNVRRELPSLRDDDTVRDGVAKMIEVGVPALPVVDASGKLRGIFGEREFIGAVFPGYLRTLDYAAFVPKSLEQALQKRAVCASEPISKYVNSEHVDVDEGHSDTQLAEIFLHHRVLIVPIVDGGRVTGVVTRSDFFAALAERVLGDVG